MILPTTYAVTLLLTILSMISWGSWANTQKLAGNRWRFELFYYDYAFGVLITTIIAAFTFGSMGADMSFADNFAIAGKTKFLYGFGAGVVFNLANMLLVAAIAVAGLSVAFPIGIGIALVVGSVSNYIINPQGNPNLLFAGVGLVVVAIILDALAYREHARSGKVQQPVLPAPEPKRGRRPVYEKRAAPTSTKGIVLSIISGLLMGSFYPLVELGKQGENGLGPYAIGLIFAIGVFVSTFIFNIYFLNLPVIGEPIGMFQYFSGTRRQHLLGIVGGAIWCVGMLTNYVAASAPREVQVGPAVSYAIGQGATMVSALWGVLVWKEFAGASARAKRLLILMFAFFVVGLTLVSIAPLYVH